MSQAMINIRMNTEEKDSFESICEQLGLSITAAFKIFAKKVIREKRIPFDLSLNSFYSDNNIEHLTHVINEIETGKAPLVEHDLIED